MAGLRVKIFARHPELGYQAGGLKFLFFFSVVLLAAINTGNNLIYLVLAALCSAVIISWILAWLSLRGLSAQVRLPEEAFAGEETRIDFLAGKRSSLLPGYFLTFKMRSEPRLDQMHQPFISRLAPGEKTRLQGLYVFPRRGRYSLGGVHVISSFPFGLISLGKLYRRKEEFFVYPKILPIEDTFERRAEGLLSCDSLFRGRGGGLLNIRPFVPGDDYRSLHWKASAKAGEMMLKEFAQEEGQVIWLHFNPLRRAEEQARDKDLFELGISMAASIAYHGKDLGLRMFFSAPGLRLVTHRNHNHYFQFMRYLAEVKIEGRMISHHQPEAVRRRGHETLLVVDPLNSDVEWEAASEILDREYFLSLMRETR